MSTDATLVSVADIVLQARTAAGMLGVDVVTDDDLKARARLACRELYDLLIAADENHVVETLSGTPAILTQERRLVLPAHFYKLLGVDFQLSGDDWRTLSQVPLNQRNDFRFSGYPAGYALRGERGLPTGIISSYLQVFPETSAPQTTYRVLFVPKPMIPANDADKIDGINGYEKFVIADVASYALQIWKRLEDAAAKASEADQTRRELKDRAAKRVLGQPNHVVITRRRGVYPWIPRN